MARSTGPILAVGAITLGNQVVMHGQPMDWRIPIGTGIAAVALALLESAWADGAAGIAWLALATVLFARTNPAVPSPVETLNSWWQGK
ncbi:hypothetical protein OG559_31125 (plasmid) [Micromonospora sp. NBC_01405]|uniref:hypothetical protein n=1 Tax=Micromonospora sp. NBC_01405 TaxID=2903589 RepID=UPI00324911D1